MIRSGKRIWNTEREERNQTGQNRNLHQGSQRKNKIKRVKREIVTRKRGEGKKRADGQNRSDATETKRRV